MIGFRSLSFVVGGLVAAAWLAAGPAAAWQTAHGDPANSGAVNVQTAPAVKPMATVPGLGGIAPGAGPVIAPNGTLYIGNTRGTLMSFRPDGTPGWSRDIGQFEGILASPAIGSDGSVYVVGTATVRDSTGGSPTTRHMTELHKFTAGGGWLWHVPLPGSEAGIVADAPPNILRIGGADVVIVPTGATFSTKLTAVAGDSGAILAHQTITTFVPEVTGGTSFEDVMCTIVGGGGCTFSTTVPGSIPPQNLLPRGTRRPLPAVAIFQPEGLIMASDGFQDLVGYTLAGGAFEERFRVHDDKYILSSTPLAWPDGNAMISTGGFETKSGVMYAGLGKSTIRASGPFSWAAPTALGGSRHVVVGLESIAIVSGVTTLGGAQLSGQSMVSAAASRNHIFVSTVDAFHSYNKKLKKVGGYQWNQGGMSQPVIGPQGHVYAVAGDTLHVFPPPLASRVVDSGTVPTVPLQPAQAQSQAQSQSGGGALAEGTEVPTAPMTEPSFPLEPAEVQASKQAYKPPVLASGNRLLACLEPDGEGCSNAQMREVAENFCRAQGFVRAEDLDVENRRTVAETLDGRRCSEKKCRVFDQIVCRR